MAAEIFITVVFMIPVYTFLIWAYHFPEDSLLFGRRWKYDEEPEFSPIIIRYVKRASVFAMIATPFVLITLFVKPSIFGLALLLFIVILVIIGAFILFITERTS